MVNGHRDARQPASSLWAPCPQLSLGCSQLQKESKATQGKFLGMLEAEKALPGMLQVCWSSLILNGDSFNKKERNPQDRAMNKSLRVLLPSGGSQVPRWATKILEQERTSCYKPTEEEHPFQSRSGKTSWDKWLSKEK